MTDLDDMIKKDKDIKKEKHKDKQPQVLIQTNQPTDMSHIAGEIRNELQGQFEEKTKFSIAEGMQDINKLGFFTEFKDVNDVLRMNKIEMWIQLAPFVFGKRSRNDPIDTKGMLAVFAKHPEQHKLNMTSLARGRERAIVDILRMDTGYVQDRAQKTFVGVNIPK